MYFIQTPIIKLTTNSTNFSDIILNYIYMYNTLQAIYKLKVLILKYPDSRKMF